MQNYLAVLFISNNSVHERYGTNLLTSEYLMWTDTYSAHVATVSAGQNNHMNQYWLVSWTPRNFSDISIKIE